MTTECPLCGDKGGQAGTVCTDCGCAVYERPIDLVVIGLFLVIAAAVIGWVVWR